MNTPPQGQGVVAPQTNQLQARTKYCLYARKSSESEERQVLSIESQAKEMLRLAERDNLEVVAIKRESHSAKNSGERPIFNELLSDVRQGKYNGILTWAPDRLSRNAGDLGALVDLMDQKLLLEIKTYGQQFSNSPNDKFLLMILCSQAKLENDNRGLNVKRGLRTRVEMGLWPGPAPCGYLNEKRVDRRGQVIVDPERAPVVRQIFEKVGLEHWSGRRIYHWLKFELNFKTIGNKNLALSNVYNLLTNPFYSGVFEYPRGSGNWYQGKHQPLISKDLFEKVQQQLKRDHIMRESREFAFTRSIRCARCGSGITAAEKYKKLKDGTVQRYIYYGCTRAKDLHCPQGYIREEELINQLTKIIDKIDINEFGLKKKFQEELERYQKFTKLVLTGKDGSGLANETKVIDLKVYLKYLLKEGNINEKREVLAGLKSWLKLKDKEVSLEG